LFICALVNPVAFSPAVGLAFLAFRSSCFLAISAILLSLSSFVFLGFDSGLALSFNSLGGFNTIFLLYFSSLILLIRLFSFLNIP
jgi:hypothetical protein